MDDKRTTHFTNVDRFTYALREYGETIGNHTFLEWANYAPGADDDLTDADRKWLNEHRAGVDIWETPNRVTITYFENRVAFANVKADAERMASKIVGELFGG